LGGGGDSDAVALCVAFFKISIYSQGILPSSKKSSLKIKRNSNIFCGEFREFEQFQRGKKKLEIIRGL
jgi:hypothetical protein